MSEPNLAHNSWSAEMDPLDQGHEDTMAVTLADEEPARLRLNLRVRESDSVDLLDLDADVDGASQSQATELERQRQVWQQEQEVLLAELIQLRSLTQEQVERIQNLEQALDQSLKSLNELRLQAVDQQFLEAQLASTEEISNVQQQAITRLKLQLAQQQQALDAQFTEIQARDHTLQELLAAMETLTQTQKAELEHLRSQLVHDRVGVQSYRRRLETQLSDLQATVHVHQQRTLQLEARSLSERTLFASLDVWLAQALVQVKHLSQQQDLLQRQEDQATLSQLEATLQQACAVLQAQPIELTAQPEPTPQSVDGPASGSTSDPSELTNLTEQELATAQTKIEELETEIAKQVTTQAMLQHACQELEVERDRQQTRIVELERQSADMQEQILKQAKQDSEYEAAIQHWKDRYWSTCSQIQHLKQAIEQALPNPPAELSEMLAALLESSTVAPSTPPLLTPPQSPQEPVIDLPEFLLRRRNYKSRRS